MYKKWLLVFLLALFQVSALDVGYNDASKPKVIIGGMSSNMLSDDNVWTGLNIFYNITLLNYSGISFNTVNQSDYWDAYDSPADIPNDLLPNDAGYWTSCSNSSGCGYLTSFTEADPYYYANPYKYLNVTNATGYFYNLTNPNKFINQTNLTNWQYLNTSNSSYIASIIQNTTISRVGNCSAGYVVMNSTTTGVQCVLQPVVNNSFTQNLTDTLYTPYENPTRNITWTNKNLTIGTIALDTEIKDTKTLSRIFFENGVIVSES